MRYLSVCSGIEAASVAWHPLGWRPLAFSEIEPFPRAVLAHHYPDVPLHGDFTVLRNEPWIVDADVLVGGTPCQAFSVAGLRKGLDDARGNLTLEFIRLADAIDDVRSAAGREPAVCVWENVPGVLSDRGNAFGCFLAGMAGEEAPLDPPRGKWTDAGVVIGPTRSAAWRVLDAQYFGLAQRRRRVFVVASARAGFDPAAVLFEPEGVQRHSPPSRQAREDTATGLTARAGNGSRPAGGNGNLVADTVAMSSGQANAEIVTDGGAPTLTCLHEAPIVTYAQAGHFGGLQQADVADPLRAKGGDAGGGSEAVCVTGDITHTLKAEGFDASEDGTGRGQPIVAHAFDARQSNVIQYGDMSGPLDTDGHTIAVAFSCKDHGADATEEMSPTLRAMGHGDTWANGGGQIAVQQATAVRRLTPTECERLQGFPDGYTAIPWRNKPASECPDGPRYKALGNSMATPCMAFIGRRIQLQLERTA